MRSAAVNVSVLGAGIAGLCAAHALASRGVAVTILEQQAAAGLGCSHWAGGMLAPWCEGEAADPLVTRLGIEALEFWTQTIPVASTHGSLVVAPLRDQPDLTRFARRAPEHESVSDLGALEPDLVGRFPRGLFFAREAHLEPRVAIAALVYALQAMSHVKFHFGADGRDAGDAEWIVDCRGLAARDTLPDLRGIRGEMLVLRTREITLSRPVRMLHPRHPVYIVPRPDHRFMVGATTIESEQRGGVTARAMLELLGAAYALHPAFGEAEVIETGADLRPAFPDNLPRIRRDGRTLFVNGLYRHGFLLAPAVARRVANFVIDGTIDEEVMDETASERKAAGRAGLRSRAPAG